MLIIVIFMDYNKLKESMLSNDSLSLLVRILIIFIIVLLLIIMYLIINDSAPNTDIVNFAFTIIGALISGLILAFVVSYQIFKGNTDSEKRDKESLKACLKNVQTELLNNLGMLDTVAQNCEEMSSADNLNIHSVWSLIRLYQNLISFEAYNDLMRSGLIFKSELLKNNSVLKDNLFVYNKLYSCYYNIRVFFYVYNNLEIKSEVSAYGIPWDNPETARQLLKSLFLKESEKLADEICDTNGMVTALIKQLLEPGETYTEEQNEMWRVSVPNDIFVRQKN